MKLFIYKTLIILIAAFLFFEFTIGQKIKKYEQKIDIFNSKIERQKMIEKIKVEIKKANKKENLFTNEEKKLLSDFIIKIQEELTVNKP